MRTSVDRRFRSARLWSNRELRKLAPLFKGDIVNVSGWDDRDKDGGVYRDYFSGAQSYAITNFAGVRGFQGLPGEIQLDLEQPLGDGLKGRFDVVLSHTTLEHVFDLRLAFHNLCLMAREAVIVVVPFAQVEHWSESYGDYWRFSGQALGRLFESEGLHLVYCSSSSEPQSAVYLIGVGVRHRDSWKGRFPEPSLSRPLANWLGEPSLWFRIYARLVRDWRSWRGHPTVDLAEKH